MKMKFAIVDGKRVEAAPGLKGTCILCETDVIARCGKIRIWHWAHKTIQTCDHWWEPKTEWHRSWQDLFPLDWQEVVHRSETGEKHIADVKTAREWVLEIQYSALRPEERQARNEFYPKLVWIVNGTRRKNDQEKFFSALNAGKRICSQPLLIDTPSSACGLLQEWGNRRVPIFFDFLELERLWLLIPSPAEDRAFVLAFSRSNFIELHRGAPTQTGDDFEKFVNEVSELVSTYISGGNPVVPMAPPPAPHFNQLRWPLSYREYLARTYRARYRRRF